MKLKSALYIGTIDHQRFSPRENSFSYSGCYFFLDLDEVPQIFKFPFLFSYNSPGILSFWEKNYLAQSTVRDLIFAKTQKKSNGPIRLLTNISYFGFCMNPVSFYYCYGADGSTVEFIVSEITNTPWGEKHQQVFETGDDINTFKFQKDFHVSPFMPMSIDYTWVFHRPQENLHVYMQNRNSGEKKVIFDSTLKLIRQPLTAANVSLAFLKFPFVTLKTMLAIYYQAAKLYLKRVPFYSHPTKEKVL
jgi:DUF1365 family protein